MLPLDTLKATFAIDPESGHLVWLRGRRAGQIAGHYSGGRRRVSVKYHLLDEGDVVVALKTGAWPPAAPPAPEKKRKKAPKPPARAKSPHPYIIVMADGRYRASAPFLGKTKHLGLFQTLEEASAAQQAFTNSLQ